MAITSRDYAYLSDLAYQRPGWRAGQLIDTSGVPSGERYQVIETMDAGTGYYGVIFKNLETGDFIVSHCGTEFEEDYFRDLVISDIQMALLEINQQVPSALFLVSRAIEFAFADGRSNSAVSVTGHSLGGTLAQISAVEYGIYGETFNAYGAADLIGDSPRGANLINHVRVTDIVGAAGKHIGELRVYASERDVDLVVPLSQIPISVSQYWALVMDRLPAGPNSTHGPEQFYQLDGYHEFIADFDHIQKYKEDIAWYDAYRFGIRSAAQGLEVALTPAIIMANITPESGTPYSSASNMFRALWLDSATNASQRVFIGTPEVDVENGTSWVDYMDGKVGDDRLSGLEGDDWLYGGAGNDTLRGGDDDDHLLGGADNDYIEGGTGKDILDGGDGNDQYEFSSADFYASPGERDVIKDSDGLGTISIDGVQLAAGERVGEFTWKSTDGKFRLSYHFANVGMEMIITHLDTKSSILIEGWNDGMFGIYLDGDVPDAPSGSPLVPVDTLFGEFGSNLGNDIVKGLAGNDGIEGGVGDDYLDGGEGNDLILGGSGNDWILGGEGDDHIFDGSELAHLRSWTKSESDQADYEIQNYLGAGTLLARGADWYVVEGGPLDGVHVPQWLHQDPNLFSSGDDYLDAGAGNDRVYAGEGEDTILGGSGNDYLNGGHDDDIISGGDGDDIIEGDVTAFSLPNVHMTRVVSDAARINGNDILDGGKGADTIRGGGGNDIIYGGLGNDELRGRGRGDTSIDTNDPDADYIDGGEGDDVMFGDDGDDTLLGGIGNDSIRGDNEFSNVHAGDDIIDGGAGDDNLSGDGGNDVVYGGTGSDTLRGDASDIDGALHGHDFLSGDGGNDQLNGGGGSDILYGGDGDDELLGDESPYEPLSSQFHGNDFIFGGKGDDLLVGNNGNDTLDGGDDNDELQGGEGSDILIGGSGNDVLFGEAGDDLLHGDAGTDTLYGGNGNDTLHGGDGNDTLAGEQGDDRMSGGAGSDVLAGGIGHDILYGEQGGDQLDGGDGNDSLDGGGGDDALYGGYGNDALSGGNGNDALAGAQGNDRYLFNLGWGIDSIQGMAAVDAGRDVIVFGPGISANDLDIRINVAGDVIIKFTEGSDQLTLLGFLGNADAGHRIEFADGTIWTQESFFAKLAASNEGLIGGSGSNLIVADQTLDQSIIYGGLGNDLLVGGCGSDTIYGGQGDSEIGSPIVDDDDIIFGGSGSDTIYAESGNDVVDAGSGNDIVCGGDGEDRIYGGAGDDQLDAGGSRTIAGIVFHETSNDLVVGGDGNDQMRAGLGENTYLFDAGFGQDTIYLTQASSYEVDQMGLASERAILRFGVGISAEQIILIRHGNEIIVQHGFDQITIFGYLGSTGTSVSFVFEDGSSLTEQQLEALTHIVGSPLGEILSGTDSDDILEGQGGDDKLVGNAGNDILAGGAGRDVLDGGAGDDTYRYGLNDGVDSIYWGNSGGHDVLELGEGILLGGVTFHKETHSSGSATLYMFIAATGNYIALNITSGQTDQTVDLIRFADGTTVTIAEAEAASTPMSLQLSFSASPGSTSLVANQFSNEIYGNSNWATTLAGGLGDDVYYLSGSSWRGVPIENHSEGNDTIVMDSYSFTLPDNIENLITRYINYWTPGQPRQLVGNALDNVIDSSAASAGFGWYGVNRLDGGLGADLLIGSGAEDIYVIDNSGDKLFEPETSGSLDTVEASVSYSIEGYTSIENITLTGIQDTHAIGNHLENRLNGFSSGGANELSGGNGNDIYVVDASDIVIELQGEGVDTVEFHGYVSTSVTATLSENIENGTLSNSNDTNLVELVGNHQDNLLMGNSKNNILSGMAGNDTLEGGDGHDTLDGGIGGDVMRGGSGGDTYFVDSIDDIVVEDGMDGYSDKVISSLDSYTMGDNIEIVELAGMGITAIGRSIRDQMIGSDSDNWLVGLGGNDEIEGRGGNDRIDGGDGADRLLGGDGNDTLDGGDGADELHGGNGDNTLDGGQGNDLLYGGSGNDLLQGGDGNDYLDAADGNNILLGGDGDDNLRSGLGNDILEGGNGFDYLYGGEGADTYRYGVGDGSDVIEDNGSDDPASVRDVLQFGTGVDTADIVVYRSTRYENMWIEIGGEIIYLTGVEDVRFENGTTLAVESIAVDFNDPPEVAGDIDQPAFIGKPFIWRIPDGAFYDEDALLYSVVEMPSWLVYDSNLHTFSGTLPTNPNSTYAIIVKATDSAGQSIDLMVNIPVLVALNGTSAANTLNGTNAAEGLFGLAGNDTLNGGGGNDYLYGGIDNDIYIIDGNGDDVVIELLNEGTDSVSSSVEYRLTDNVENLTLTGSSQAWGEGNDLNNIITGNSATNELYGGGGNDTLIGNGGADYLYGGLGNDTYQVDAFDQIMEWEGEGIDTVQSSVAWTLTDNFENLTLTGSSGISGHGNELDNAITGNSGVNTLYGYEGNDTLDGGSGNDIMIGGAGNDTFFVNASGDSVTEIENEGSDLVISSVTYTLSNHIENLTLAGTSAINGTGNAMNNIIVGNSGKNTLTGGSGDDTLDGGLGIDTLVGGIGNDTYIIDTASDVVTEQAGQGDDSVFSGVTYTLGSNVENLILTGSANINATGNTGNNQITGNSGNNLMSAGTGDDVLDGGVGVDTLTGGSGNDTYIMDRAYGVDTVVDTDSTTGNLDVIKFLAGTTYDQLWFRRPSASANLEISIIGTSDKLIISNWYSGSQNRIEEIQVNDGEMVLHMEDVETLVNVMAGMTMPTQGQITLTPSQQNALAATFASTWQSRSNQGNQSSSMRLMTTQQPALVGEVANDLSQAWDSTDLFGVADGFAVVFEGHEALPFELIADDAGGPIPPFRRSYMPELDHLISAMAAFRETGSEAVFRPQYEQHQGIHLSIPMA